MGKVLVVAGGDGIGGLINGFQVAHFLKEKGKRDLYNVDVKVSASDKVYQSLEYLFSDKFNMEQLPIQYSQNHRLLSDSVLWSELKAGYDSLEYICPDLTYKYFDYKKYHVLPNTVRGVRLLTHKFRPQNQIYLALNTTTVNYNYKHVHSLLLLLSGFLPDFTIHLPVLDTWSGLEVKKMELPERLPDNVVVHKNPEMTDQLDILSKCIGCICLDNGMSHVSYHLGQIRILLDPHFAGDLAWKIRWREDLADSIDMTTSPATVARLMTINVSCPETQLLTKREVIDVISTKNLFDWKQELFLKY
jgi:hypothetical protein